MGDGVVGVGVGVVGVGVGEPVECDGEGFGLGGPEMLDGAGDGPCTDDGDGRGAECVPPVCTGVTTGGTPRAEWVGKAPRWAVPPCGWTSPGPVGPAPIQPR